MSESTEAVLLGACAQQAEVPAGFYRVSARVGGDRQVSGFALDRYPVTVERFSHFIDAGGYDDEDCWDLESWRWRIDHDIEHPRFWLDEGWPLFRRFQRASRPVVGVSWYEARAFCRWARRRLPTELELEVATRGSHGGRYPWGDHWEEGRVAVRGVGPRVTWPVGYFPQSVGPFGHHDLVGNVWQWTSDPFRPSEPDGAMCVRGGSWASRPEQAGADHLNGYTRGGRHSHVGFRTAAGAVVEAI